MRYLNWIALGFEVSAVSILAISGAVTLFKWFTVGVEELWAGIDSTRTGLKKEYGHQIVFALEFFITADLIKSIQAPTFAELGKLAIIVIIRTVLHYSLSD